MADHSHRMGAITRKTAVLAFGFVLLAALPGIAHLMDEPFLVSTFSRVLIYAMAAVSLDLILGYGGMVSFGHAAFFGVGAYVVGILAHHAAEGTTVLGLAGTNLAVVSWAAAVLVSAGVAAVIGALSLRTDGVHFIMITLAFAQMLFFLFVSLEPYGGDDGLMMMGRNDLFGIDLSDDMTFYYLCFIALMAFLLLTRRLVDSRFGMVIRGCKQNERRMRALGFPVYRYKLTAFVIAGAGAGLAGALSANHTEFVSPDFLHWTMSGDIMIIVILGGIGTLYGPVVGAVVFLMLEEFLPLAFDSVGLEGLKEHWRFLFGPILILVVLFARRGLFGLLAGREARDG